MPAPPFRVGGWLPSDQAVLEEWVRRKIEEAEAEQRPFHAVIEEFQDFIEGTPEAFMLFSEMFTEVRHNLDPAGNKQVRDYRQFLRLLNHIMTSAPEFNESGLVGFPINAILDWSMGTTAGYAAFLRDDVNYHLKLVLDEWARFLGSGDSVGVLTDGEGGWFSEAALAAMAPAGTDDPRRWFEETFVCDPGEPHYGYTSWDDFFTRVFRAGRRPVADPDDPRVIVNACESAPYKIERDVQRRARFWVKGQPYSLEHMMAHDPWLEHFEFGTVYQAFLSATSFHRWHSPVDGTVVKAYVVPGTYYSESLANRHDPAGPNESQGYITAVATRALIFIEADDPAIGLMCVMPVGMAEVSTCEVTVYEGQHVDKGDEIGMFHFGGSTHCLFFRPQVRLEFDLHGQEPGLESSNIPVNARLARVVDDGG